MDTNRLRLLLDKRDEIDRELVSLVTGNGSAPLKKPVKCSSCGDTSHTARNCPQRMSEGATMEDTPS